MADFSFRLKAGVTIDQAVSRLQGLEGDVDSLRQSIEDLIDSTGKSTNQINLGINVEQKGRGTISSVTNQVKTLSKEEEAREKQLKKLLSTEQNSITSLRQRLNTEKQLRGALAPGTAAYAERDATVKRLEATLRRAQGVQDGSVNAIRAEGRALFDQLNNINLSEAQRNRLTQAISANAEAERRAQGIRSGSIADLRAQQAEQQRLADTLRAGTAEQVRAQQAAQALGNQISALTPRTLTFIGALNKLATIQAGIQAITAIFGQIAGSIDRVVKRVKEVEAFDLALRNLGVSAADSARAFGQAATTANNLGAPIQQVEKAYKRITPALRDIGASAEDTDKFIENLTARTQVLGLTTEESGRLQEAFAQVLAKGKLQAEELTQQIAEVDGAFRTQFAAALGVTSAELNDLVKQGQVTSSVFVKGVNAMSNGVELLKGNIESGNATVQQLQNIIANLNLKTLEEIGRIIEPGIRAFLEAGTVFAKFVQEVVSSPLGQLLGDVFNQVAGATKNFIVTLTSLLSVLLQIISPIAELLRLFTPVIGAFVFLAASIQTANGLIVAFTAVTKAAQGAALANANSINFAAQAITRFGTAIKSLLGLKFKDFIVQSAGSLTSLGRSLNLDTITTFGKRLKDLQGKAGGAAPTLKTLISNVNNVGSAAQGSNVILSPLSKAIAQATKTSSGLTGALGSLGTSTQSYAGSLGILKPALASSGASFGKFGLAVGAIKGSLGATGAAAGSTGGALAATGATATAAGGAATAGAAGFGALLASLLPVAVVAAAVIGTLALLSFGFNKINTASRLTGGAMKSLDGDLQRLGVGAKKGKTLWQGFVDGIVSSIPLVNTIRGIFQGLGRVLQSIGFAEQAAQLRKTVQQVDAEFKQAGLGGVTDFSNASKLSGKEAGRLVNILGALAKSQDEVAAAIQKEINEKEAKGELDKEEEVLLKRRLYLAKEASAGFQILQRQLAAATAEQRKKILAEKEELTAVEASKVALEEKNAQIERAQTVLNTDATKKYNQGLITEAQLQLDTGAAAVAAAQAKLNAIKQEEQALAATKAKNLQDVNQRQQLEEELSRKRIEAEAAVAEAQKEFREAEIRRIQEVIQNAEELANVYLDSANTATSALNDFGSTIGSSLDSVRKAISTQAAIEFQFTGDDRVLQDALNAQAQVLQFEYTIGKVKAQIAQQERQAELALQQLRLQGLLAEAEADPNADSRARRVAALQSALSLTQQIGSLQQTQAAAENLALQAATQQQQQALNLQREALGLPPVKIVDEQNYQQLTSNLTGILTNAQRQAEGIGPAIGNSINQGIQTANTGVGQLKTTVSTLETQQAEFNRKLAEGVTKLGEAAKEISAKNYGVKLGEELKKALGGSFESFNKTLSKSPEIAKKVSSGAVDIKNNFGSLNTTIQGTNTLLESTAGRLQKVQGLARGLPAGSGPGSLAQPLATGGPVTAGSQYFVNDGGGREAFVDMQGRFKMLPAGRNIHWRAPKAGYVLPAPMTNDIIQNSKINAKIQAAAANVRPKSDPNSYNSGISSSGNLIKQVGSMMSGGNTQRITNHVTIQSQSPVMDASKIMANVARMKARRGIMS